jgi:hypothetical protein
MTLTVLSQRQSTITSDQVTELLVETSTTEVVASAEQLPLDGPSETELSPEYETVDDIENVIDDELYKIVDVDEHPDGTVIVELEIADPENYTWADGTNPMAIKSFNFRLTQGESYTWLVVLLLCVTVLETGWLLLQLDQWNKLKKNGGRFLSVAPILLALMPVWQLSLIIVFSILSVLLLAANLCLAIRIRQVRLSTVTAGADPTSQTSVLEMQSPAVNGASAQPAYPMMGTVGEEEELLEDDPNDVLLLTFQAMDGEQMAQFLLSAPEQASITNASGEITELMHGLDRETGIANVTMYKRSFTARLTQAPTPAKVFYTSLKNEITSFKHVKSHISWEYDRISVGRRAIVKFAVRGKTLCVYMAFDPNDFTDGRYKIEKTTQKKFEDTPCLYRITNARRAKLCKELFSMLAEQFGLKHGEEQARNYYFPYESTERLVEQGLIREYEVTESYWNFLCKKKQSIEIMQRENEETEEQTEADHSKDAPYTVVGGPSTETVDDLDEELCDKEVYDSSNQEPAEVVREVDHTTGIVTIVHYQRSFMARLIQLNDEEKSFYSMLKNNIMSYSGTTSEVTWDFENIKTSRGTIARFCVRGSTLCLYMALDPNKYAGQKYQVEQTICRKYECVPCLYRIKNAKRAQYATELIAELAQIFSLPMGDEQNEIYHLPYDNTKSLVERGLIQETVTQENYVDYLKRRGQKEIDKLCLCEVHAGDAQHLLKDDWAIALIDDKREGKETSGKRAVVYLDRICEHYSRDETVDLNSLIKKGLVDRNVSAVKVLARGRLNKPLTVEANDFSIEAVKMILLVGGKVIRI